jgi:tetratricopeptide (TPR) repeat protein
MSVINNVLKALESRESQFTPIEIPSIEAAPPTRRGHKLIFLIGFGLLLVLAAAWNYLQNPFAPEAPRPPVPAGSAQVQTAPVAPQAEAVPESVAISAAAAPTLEQETTLPGNQIAGLQISETETELRLEFLLRERVVAYLKDRAENSFSYHLRDIESRIDAPSMRGNRWIRELTIVESEDGVVVNFVTGPDILVETRQGEQDGETVWVINLRQARQEPAVSVAKPEPPVVAQAAPKVEAADEPVETEPDAPVTLTIKPTNPDAKTNNQLDYAVELMNSRRYDDADELLRGLLDGTHDYSARKHLMVLYARVNRPQRLRTLLQASLLEYPSDPLFEAEYARTLFTAAAYHDVIALFADRSVLNADQQALLAASYQRLDQHEAAVLHYQLALGLDTRNARNWVGLGISQEQVSAFVDALASYQQASELGTLNARLKAFVARRSEQLRQVLN